MPFADKPLPLDEALLAPTIVGSDEIIRSPVKSSRYSRRHALRDWYDQQLGEAFAIWDKDPEEVRWLRHERLGLD